jgi:hypothetical protein
VAGVSHALAPDPWPVAAWCAGRGPCYLVRAWWPELRRPGPRAVLPGARPGAPGPRSVAPGACALVAAGRGACAWWRAPWCLAAGARSGSPGRRRADPVPAPGPKKRARSRASQASARFYTADGGQNSFTGPYPGTGMFHVKQSRKQAPFDQLVNSCENFSQFKSK